MELNTTAQVREAIRAIPRSQWDALAHESRVPRSTLEKIAYGVTANPSFEATVGLIQALKRRHDRETGDGDDTHEDAAPAPAQHGADGNGRRGQLR